MKRKLSSAVSRERNRCAGIAENWMHWCKENYPDEPAQWLRCETILNGILKNDR